MGRYDTKRMDAEEITRQAKYFADKKAEEKHAKFESHFGIFGRYILEAGTGGGFTAIPHAIDIYQAALGLSIKEAWYIKLICRYLPNIYPSMSIIAKRTGVRPNELSNIKKGLVAKGFIRDNGAVDKRSGKLQRELNITPFFNAIAICILCDADSNVTKEQVRDKVRTAFTRDMDNGNTPEYYSRLENFGEIELPLRITTAQELAKAYGNIVLNWEYIYRNLQGDKVLEKLESVETDTRRRLEVKNAINEGRGEAFGIVYYPGKGRGYEWLNWLCSTSLTNYEIEKLTASYVEQAEQPTAKEYMQWVSVLLETPQNKKLLAEREVYHAEYAASKKIDAMIEAEYAE